MIRWGRDSIFDSVKLELVVFNTDANRDHVLCYLHHVFPIYEVGPLPSFRSVSSFMISSTKVTI
jgi:hypothetical protein